jgi:hypothetical protein
VWVSASDRTAVFIGHAEAAVTVSLQRERRRMLLRY